MKTLEEWKAYWINVSERAGQIIQNNSTSPAIDEEIQQLRKTIRYAQQRLRELEESKKSDMSPSRVSSIDVKLQRLNAFIMCDLSWKKAAEVCGLSIGGLRQSVQYIERLVRYSNRHCEEVSE